MTRLSVILPTHQPDRERLRRTLQGLRQQTLAPHLWETLVVDNACAPRLEAAAWDSDAPPNLRIVAEPTLGLSHARRRGFTAARSSILVLVDDDNVLALDYLAHVLRLFATQAQLGAIGGRCLPEFEKEPAAWTREFLPLLALRDPGPRPLIAASLRPAGADRDSYPGEAAPIGAGMALRRAALSSWLEQPADAVLSDRRGPALSSGGDNDIVLTLMRGGWGVGYFPELTLTHLIPAARLTPGHLARLNRGIQSSWMRVLSKHRLNPWPLVPPWSVPLRQARAWFTHRAWAGPTGAIRWQGACGHFEGRAMPR